jgi:hypothetical protein
MILAASPNDWHRRARTVRVSGVRAAPGPSGYPQFTMTARSTQNDDGSPRRDAPRYKVTITQVSKHGHLLVDCECLAHPFWGGEVSLYMRNAAEIKRSNGRPPRVRNPSLYPWGCKHILSSLKALIAAGKIR